MAESRRKTPTQKLEEKLGPEPDDEAGLDPEGVAAQGLVELKGDDQTVVAYGEPEAKPIVVLMAEILDELPSIGKEGTADKSMGGYAFRKIDDVLIQANPLLAKKGVVPVPRVLSRLGEERFTRGGAALYVTHLEVAYRFYGPRGDYLEAVVWGEGMDNFDKATNKAMTTAFKNALIQVFAIATGEPDPDDGTHEETTGGRRPAQAGANAEVEAKRKAEQTEANHAKAVAGAVALGWTDGEEALRLHRSIGERIKALGDEDEQDKTLIADFRAEAKLPWPMGPDDWTRLDEFISTLEGPGPEPGEGEGSQDPPGDEKF